MLDANEPYSNCESNVYDIPPGFVVTALAVGMQHTCALQIDGAVIYWGYNGDGQLGIGSSVSKGTSPDQTGSNLTAVDLGPGETRSFVIEN